MGFVTIDSTAAARDLLALVAFRALPVVAAAVLSRSLGPTRKAVLAVAYVGTRYTADESMTVPELPDLTITTGSEISIMTKFVSGYFADFNMEWAANERTGLYGGLGTQKISAFSQSLDGRTARIDIGSAMAIRGGINIKF